MMGIWYSYYAAILSSSEGRTSDTICDEEGGPKACLAGDCIWGIACVLVRAHQPYDLLINLQEPPLCGVSRKATHSKQVTFFKPTTTPHHQLYQLRCSIRSTFNQTTPFFFFLFKLYIYTHIYYKSTKKYHEFLCIEYWLVHK